MIAGLPEREDEPTEFKRRRITSEFDRVGKQTFVESMLNNIADTLAADAEYGHNSANRIRRRVEDIAAGLDTEAEVQTSAGRAVLESRFATGHDDSQYLAQAVSLLWAGDGGERLRLVPPAAMPEIMRVASSRGLVRAMASVLDRKRKEANGVMLQGLDTVAWALQVDEVRLAVVEFMKESQFDAVKQAAAALELAYNGGNEAGVDHVKRLPDNEGDADVNRLVIKELMEAFYVLVDPVSRPSRIVSSLTGSMRKVVRKADQDCSAVFDVAMAMNSLAGLEITREDKNIPVGGTGRDMCPEYDELGNSLPPAYDIPNVRQFATAVTEAFRRMASHHESIAITGNRSNVLSDAEYTEASTAGFDAQKSWYLSRTVSPIWDNGEIKRPNEQPRLLDLLEDDDCSTPLADYVAGAFDVALTKSRKMRTALDSHVRGKDSECIKSARSRDADDGLGTVSTRMMPGTEFISFCLIRGVCGIRGPHQLPSDENDRTKYNYPTVKMRRYTKGSIYNQGKSVTLQKESVMAIAAKEQVVYAGAEENKINTDFAGHVIGQTVSTKHPQSRYADYEDAVPVKWAPVNPDATEESDLINYSEPAHMVSEAAVYELIASSLSLPDQQQESESACRLMRAAAACAKMQQLVSLTYVMNNIEACVKAAPTDDRLPADQQFVTRPCHNCRPSGEPYYQHRLHVPADAGLAWFKRDGASESKLFIMEQNDPVADAETGYFSSTPLKNVDGVDRQNIVVRHELLSSWLRDGMERSWTLAGAPIAAGAYSGIKNFSLMMESDAQNEPVDTRSPHADTPARLPIEPWLAPIDVEPDAVRSRIATALNAIENMDQMDCEEAYIAKLGEMRSEEQQGVFGIYRTIEDASRDRRADIWSDALREVAISGDRLYRFVVTLTGAIGEAADSAISWEDEDLKQLSKEAATRQKALAERVSRFQTKLVESVVSSTLKASKLQLDVRSGSAGDELVVMSSEVKDNIRQITSGEAGHGFFESSVELNNLIGTSSRPLKINDVVKKLQSVSMEFQQQVSESLAPSAPASYSRIAEPRNSFMLHLKPDTTSAIQKAFDFITSELRHCSGFHRHIHLWEFVEGKDWVLVTRFAELVGLMLQNTRMRSGSFAAYVGTTQLIANGQNIRMQIQRLRGQACMYLAQVPSTPHFLQKFGRTQYFGGAIAPAGDDTGDRLLSRKRRLAQSAPFGGDDGDDDSADKPDDDFVARYVYKPAALRRMGQVARMRRAAIFKALQSGEVDTRFLPLPITQLVDAVSNLDSNNPLLGVSNGAGLATWMASTRAVLNSYSADDQEELAESATQMAAALATGVTGASAVASGCDKFASNTMWKSACDQLKKDLKFESDGFLEFPKEREKLAGGEDSSVLGRKRLHYVVNLDLSKVELETAYNPLTVTSNKALHNSVHVVLQTLFNFRASDGASSAQKKRSNYYRWRPHPQWTAGVDNKYTNKWVRQVDVTNDERFRRWGRVLYHLITNGISNNIRASSTLFFALVVLGGSALDLSLADGGYVVRPVTNVVGTAVTSATTKAAETPVAQAVLRAAVAVSSVPGLAYDRYTSAASFLGGGYKETWIFSRTLGKIVKWLDGDGSVNQADNGQVSDLINKVIEVQQKTAELNDRLKNAEARAEAARKEGASKTSEAELDEALKKEATFTVEAEKIKTAAADSAKLAAALKKSADEILKAKGKSPIPDWDSTPGASTSSASTTTGGASADSDAPKSNVFTTDLPLNATGKGGVSSPARSEVLGEYMAKFFNGFTEIVQFSARTLATGGVKIETARYQLEKAQSDAYTVKFDPLYIGGSLDDIRANIRARILELRDDPEAMEDGWKELNQGLIDLQESSFRSAMEGEINDSLDDNVRTDMAAVRTLMAIEDPSIVEGYTSFVTGEMALILTTVAKSKQDVKTLFGNNPYAFSSSLSRLIGRIPSAEETSAFVEVVAGKGGPAETLRLYNMVLDTSFKDSRRYV